MSFSITNNSTNAVITNLDTLTSTDGSLTITVGSLPLYPGQTISGTNTQINNQKGSQQGSILLFMVKGSCKIDYTINSVLVSSENYSSGWVELKGPIVQVADTVSIAINDTILPTPSPTPSSTPAGATPTPTVTASPTPSVTPTFTPTPSSTPAVINPQSLGALWWVDFTDAGTLTITSGQVRDAVDKIGGVHFSGVSNTPIYNATGYLGVSGTTQQNSSPLNNALGVYGAFDELTWFGFIYDDGTQNGGTIYEAYETPGFPAGFRFSFFGNNGGGATNYDGNERTNNSTVLTAAVNISGSSWVAVALRSYNSAGNVVVEVWQNGSIIGSNTQNADTCFSVTNPQFRLMFNGGIDLCTEEFFFDRKLSNTEMAQMFQYLSDKY